jgi:hypothetical protein
MATETIINYFDLSNERVFYPGTAGYQRRKFDTRPTTIHDLRGQEKEFTLEENGFVVLQANWSEEDVEDTPEHIQNVVFPETIEKVKQAYVYLLDCKWVKLAENLIVAELELAQLMSSRFHISFVDIWQVLSKIWRRA